MERTLVLCKPDCVQRRLVASILQRFESKGLKLVGLKLLQASRELASKHYAVHEGKPFYESLLSFLTSGPTVAIVLEGPSAIAIVRNIMGPTDGTKAPPGTIRGDHASSIQNNLVHGSDSPESASTEIALWFDDSELVSFEHADEAWIIGGD